MTDNDKRLVMPQKALEHIYRSGGQEGRAIGLEEAATLLDIIADNSQSISPADIKVVAIGMREQAKKYRSEAEAELTEMAILGNVPDLLGSLKDRHQG